jgi:hypothetical protein
LKVDNPSGFETRHFLALDHGKVQVDAGSLRQARVVLPTVSLRGIHVNLERSGGRTNYGAILANLERLEEPGQAPQEPADQARGFVIQDLVISDVNAHVQFSSIAGKTALDVNVPEIRLHNIGSGSDGGVPMSGVVAVVAKAVLKAIADQRGDLPIGLARDLRAELGRLAAVRIEVPRAITGAGEELEREAGKRLRGAAEQALKGVGGLLQRDKRD